MREGMAMAATATTTARDRGRSRLLARVRMNAVVARADQRVSHAARPNLSTEGVRRG